MAEVWKGLPDGDRATATILAGNYGEAGALRYHGRAHGLPPAVSPHNSFHPWGPGGAEGSVVVAVGYSRERLLETFLDVEEAGLHVAPYAMPSESELLIYVCRGWRRPLEEAWREARFFI